MGLSQLLTDFGGKFVAMEENIKAQILSSANALEEKLGAKKDATVSELRARIEQLETVVEDLRKPEPLHECKEIDSRLNTDNKKAESSSKTLSWMVNNVHNSGDGFPIACAAKKPSHLTKSNPNESVEKEVSSKLRVLSTKKPSKSEHRGNKVKNVIKQEIVVHDDVNKAKKKETIKYDPSVGLSDSEGFSKSEDQKKKVCGDFYGRHEGESSRDARNAIERRTQGQKKRRVQRSKTQVHPCNAPGPF